jgi:VCBS repeat-containing protein
MYVTGGTGSTIGFPVVGAIQPTNRGGFEMFVTKISANGDAVLFSTYVGGPLTDVGYNIEVDAQQAIYVVGTTTSVDNPATPANEGMPVVNAFQPTFGGVQDAFVFKMNPSGTLFEFATYLGGTGSESADATLVAPTGGVAVDAQGNVYVAGHTQSANFPTTPNRLHAYTGSQDCFVTKLDPTGTALVYSTFLGGAGVIDVCLGLAVDPTGSAYVTGYSNRGFPLVDALPMYAGILNTNNGTALDAIVSKLSPDGGSLIYSTYLGGRARDQAHDIAVDARGNAYITGVTFSFTFPLAVPLDSNCAGCTEGGQFEGSNEAFVAKLALGNLSPGAADDDDYQTDEDVVLTVDAPGVLANDTDGNSDPLTAVLLTAPVHGTLNLAADGSFTYTPATDWSGTDTFTYKASDGTLESSPATVTLTVEPVNDAPAADAGGPYTADEGTAVTLMGAGNDVEGDTLSYAWDLDNDGTFETPGQAPALTAPDGPATLTVFLRVTDSGDAVGTASATVSVANRVPVAAADAYSTAEDTPLVVAAPGVLGNDQDFDALSAVLVTGPAHGTLTLGADGSFQYAPAADFNGTDAFTYRVQDGVDSSDPVTVTLGVDPVNDPPSADAGGPYTVGEGGSLTLAGSGQDVEAGALTFAWDLDNDGTFETPGATPVFTAGNGPATLNVTLRVSDAGGASATSAGIVDVLNAAPVAAADAFAATAGVALTVGAPGVLGNDTDFDTLTAVLVTAPTQGTLTLAADGSFEYVPGPGAAGADSFTYAASDGLATSAAATVTITVAASGPDAVDDTFAVKRRLRPHTLDVLANDDAGANGPLTLTGVSSPAHGTATIAPDGRSITYRARFRFLGSDTFTYTVTDGNGGTDTATVTVTVTRRRNP